MDLAQERRVQAVRAFNRMWAKRVGALGASLLESPFSLTECRVLFELAQQPEMEVGELRTELSLDAGYLSRILGSFKAKKLVTTEPSASDGRKQVARLTASGRRTFAGLNDRSTADVRTTLDKLTDAEQGRLVNAMETIRALVGDAPRPKAYLLRAPRPGDFGWMISRHGAVYAQEHGFDQSFEGLVARIVADYVERHDPQKEAAFIAEVDGEPAGCVLCVKNDDETAQLRVLLVDPKGRGLGIGARLVDECIRFARGAGYRRMVLWTNGMLLAARRIYQRAGFVLVHEEPVRNFGQDVTSQDWELTL